MHVIEPKKLRWPDDGVSDVAANDLQLNDYSAPFALNVMRRPPWDEGRIGGSRIGLVPYSTLAFKDIEGVFPVPWTDSDGVKREKVAVIDGGKLFVIDGDTDATQTPLLDGEDDAHLLTEDGSTIDLSASIQSLGYLEGGFASGCVLGGKLYIQSSILHCYDPKIGMLSTVQNAPTGMRGVFAYRGRLFVYGPGNMWYCSAVGNPEDWDWGKSYTDTSRAMAGELSLAGKQGDNITAMIPCDDKAVIASTRNSLWKLLGDPATGDWRCISRETGILSPTAAAHDSGWLILAVGDDGLNFIDPWTNKIVGMETIKRIISKLMDVGMVEFQVVYDYTLRGFLVFSQEEEDYCWFVDSRKVGAWPFMFPTEQHPICAGRNTATDNRRVRIIYGCADGKLRQFSIASTSDCGKSIRSAVILGPICGHSDCTVDALLAEVYSVLKVPSGTVRMAVHSAQTSNQAADRAMLYAKAYCEGNTAETDFEIDVHDGWNHVARPRVRGNWFCITYAGDVPWAFESGTVVQRALGRIRNG